MAFIGDPVLSFFAIFVLKGNCSFGSLLPFPSGFVTDRVRNDTNPAKITAVPTRRRVLVRLLTPQRLKQHKLDEMEGSAQLQTARSHITCKSRELVALGKMRLYHLVKSKFIKGECGLAKSKLLKEKNIVFNLL